jgi:hypothetical protein
MTRFFLDELVFETEQARQLILGGCGISEMFAGWKQDNEYTRALEKSNAGLENSRGRQVSRMGLSKHTVLWLVMHLAKQLPAE